MSRIKQIIREIHRRSLWQVLGIYLFGSWGVLEVVETLTSSLGLPDWFPAFALVLLLVGLPVVLATAFVQEGTPELGVLGTAEPVGADHVSAPEAVPAPEPGRGAAWLLTWRNAAIGGLSALALAGVVATTWLLLGGAPITGSGIPGLGPGPTEPSATRLAVMPFRFRGSEEYAYLEEGMVNLLSTKLDGAAGLRTVDPRALLGVLADDAARELRLGSAEDAAASLGAGLFVLGDIVEAAGRLRIHAALHRGGRDEPEAEASAEGTTEEVFAMVDDIAAQLLANAIDGRPTRMTRIAAVTTASLPALKAYLQGEEAFRAAHFRDALVAYQEAVAHDSLFALAYYRLSIAAEWLVWEDVAIEAADRAYTHAGRLSERDRQLLQAFLAWRRGEHDTALNEYRSLLATWPDEVEAWFQYGEVLFHGNPLHGQSPFEARSAFERVLRYEPDHAASLLHLVRLAAGERRPAQLDSLAARFLEVSGEGDRAVEVLALRAFTAADEVAQRRVLDELAAAPDATVYVAGNFLSSYGGGAEASLQLARLLTRPDRSDRVRAIGHVLAAHALLGLGRRREARAEREAAAELDRRLERELALHAMLLPPVPPDDAAVDRLHADLVALRGTEPPREGAAGMFNPHGDFREAVYPYLLGLIAAQRGDSARAARLAEEARAARLKTGAGSLGEDLARAVLAEIHVRRGRSEAALDELLATRRDIFFEFTNNSPYVAQSRSRFLLAEMLHGEGDRENALRWYGTVHDSYWDLPYRPVAHLRMGEILEGMGRVAEASASYRRTLELLERADPDYGPWKADAQRGLERLSAADRP